MMDFRKRARFVRPRTVVDADAAKARQLRETGIAATPTSRKCLASPAPPCTAT